MTRATLGKSVLRVQMLNVQFDSSLFVLING